MGNLLKAFSNPFYRTSSLEILLFFAGWGIWWSFFQIWLTSKQGFSGAQVGTIYTFGSAVALVLMFGVLFGGKQTPEKGDVINFRSVCLLMVVCIVALRANVVSRLFRNIEPILCLYLPNLLAEKEEKEKRAGWILCVICFIAYATVIQLLRTPAWQRTYPYLFFWS